jgi:hypothetical protein
MHKQEWAPDAEACDKESPAQLLPIRHLDQRHFALRHLVARMRTKTFFIK